MRFFEGDYYVETYYDSTKGKIRVRPCGPPLNVEIPILNVSFPNNLRTKIGLLFYVHLTQSNGCYKASNIEPAGELYGTAVRTTKKKIENPKPIVRPKPAIKPVQPKEQTSTKTTPTVRKLKFDEEEW